MAILSFILRLILQIVLLFMMLFCDFGFAASYEFPGFNRYHVMYTLLLVVFSFLFIKLAGKHPAHRTMSHYMVSFTTLIWIFVVVRNLFYV